MSELRALSRQIFASSRRWEIAGLCLSFGSLRWHDTNKFESISQVCTRRDREYDASHKHSC